MIICVSLLSQLITLVLASDRWSNHDISTLKLLQIVHRHGDRTPTKFTPNDPYRDQKYWGKGIGHLTTTGKYRMYKLGKFIRDEYNSYLGEKYSPREVYARSSAYERCIESTSCLLSGVYPPKSKEWQWNIGSDPELGHLWQPISIETFIPKNEDLVLNQEKYCPIAIREKEKIYNSDRVKLFLEDHKELYKNLSKVVGHKFDSIENGRSLHETLSIEMDHNYYWNDIWTEKEEKNIVEKLLEVHRMAYRLEWNSTVIKRLRAGGLVKELIKNFQSVIDDKNNKKLFVYSTHDSMIGILMHALNIFNDNLVPFGATLMFELHQKDLNFNKYFVKVYFLNETFNGIPHAMSLNDCHNSYECPFAKFIDSTRHLIYSDFDEECNRLSTNKMK